MREPYVICGNQSVGRRVFSDAVVIIISVGAHYACYLMNQKQAILVIDEHTLIIINSSSFFYIYEGDMLYQSLWHIVFEEIFRSEIA